jgi:hypothetical protein
MSPHLALSLCANGSASLHYEGLASMASLRITKWKSSRVRSAALTRLHAHHDPLTGLVLRVLYRLRTLSESAPLDGATFSYASPLLAVILKTGGIGLQGEDSDPAEQIILVLDIINFHSGECKSHVVNGMVMLIEIIMKSTVPLILGRK